MPSWLNRTIIVNALAVAGSILLYVFPTQLTTDQWAAISAGVLAIVNLFLPPIAGGGSE